MGSGIASSNCRRPRGLSKRKQWKAHEWKLLALSTSLIAHHGRITEAIPQGWNIFVKLVQRVCEWHLEPFLVDKIDVLAKAFYQQFADHYQALLRDRIRLCKYTYLLLLHLGDRIRNCGPVSLLGQWSMENVVVTLTRKSKARTQFAEAVREKVKYEAAARIYGLRNGIQNSTHGRKPSRRGDQ